MHSSHLRSGELCSPFWRREFFCMGHLFLLPYLFISSVIDLCMYGFMDVYFVLQVIVQYYFFFPLLKLFQLWLLGALSAPRFSLTYFQPLVVFLKIYIFMCLSTSLFLGTTKCSRLIMFHPRISYSSKEPRFLSLETGGKNQVLVTRHTWIICIYYVHT